MIKYFRRNKYIYILGLILLTSLLIFVVCAPAPTPSTPTPIKVTELVMATGTPKTSSVSPLIEKMARAMEEYSNGDIKVKVYWAGEIAEVKDLPELVKKRSIDMMVVPPVHFPSLFPLNSQLTMFSVLLQDLESTAYIWRGLFKGVPEVQGEFQKQNHYLLNRIAIGPYLTLSKEPIRTKADFKGKKIRGMPGKYFSQILEKVGAVNLATITVPEIYEALMRGAVDAVMLIPQDFVDLKFYEVAKYVSLPAGCIVALCCSINLDTWNSLSDAAKKALIRAATEWGSNDLANQLDTYKKSIENLKSKGMQFVEFDKNEWNTILAEAGDPWKVLKDTLVSDYKVDPAITDKYVTEWIKLKNQYEEQYSSKGKKWIYE